MYQENSKLVRVFFLCFFVLSMPAKADPIDTYINGAMQAQHIPGLSLAVVVDGKLVKAKGYGLSNVELDSIATEKTIYQSGSIGKQFTAALTMILVEKGLLRLDDLINQYFPDAPADWKEITIKHLLTHTSGLVRDISWVDLHLDYTHEQLIHRLYAEPLLFNPGTGWSYSNSGYEMLGFILEKITHKSYGDLLQEHIFQPLEMTTARTISDRDVIKNRAAGYDWVDGKLKNQEYVSSTFNSTADGALYFTVLDLAKWDAALYTTKLMNQENMNLLWTPAQLKDGKTVDYGLGWRLSAVDGQHVMEHGGEWQGFTAFITRYVDEKLTIIVMTNLSGNAKLGDVTHQIAAIYRDHRNEIKRQF